MKLKKKITKISEPKDDSSIIIERENQKVKKYIASHLWTGKQQKLASAKFAEPSWTMARNHFSIKCIESLGRNLYIRNVS